MFEMTISYLQGKRRVSVGIIADSEKDVAKEFLKMSMFNLKGFKAETKITPKGL